MMNSMNSTARPADVLATASQMLNLDAMGRQQPSSLMPPYAAQMGGGLPQKTIHDMTKDELWKIAHSANLSGLRPQSIPPPTTSSKGIPFDPTGSSFEDLDLTFLGLPTVRGGRRRERDLPLQDPAAILAGLGSIPDIASRHKTYSRGELEEWPLVDIIIHMDLVFIILDAPGFDLQSYYFEEAEPDVLVMIGQKTHQAALVELTNAPDNIWVFRQRPLGNTFIRKIDLRRFNFKLDPSTLTYGNYNGCIVYRGLRKQPVRPKQLFRYI